MSKQYIKTLFGIVGFVCLIYIVNNYGISNILNEFSALGSNLIIILLTFIPVLLCYSFSWFLITDLPKKQTNGFIRTSFIFWLFMTISVAWNNLTPFLKMGGEPVKYILLQKKYGHRIAIASTLNYNIIHIFSTLLSFFIFCLLVLIFVPLYLHGICFS